MKFNYLKDHPKEAAEMKLYCGMDVDQMYEASKLRPDHNITKRERRYYLLDQQINDTGIPVDLERAAVLLEIAQEASERLTQECIDLCGIAPTQVGKLAAYLDLPNLQKATVINALADDKTSDKHIQILEIRQEVGLSSAKKVQKFIDCAHEGRIRGALVYRGAEGTGRFSGSLIQPQNLPRPVVLEPEQIEEEFDNKTYGGRTIHFVKDAIRSLIRAPKGQQLVSVDLNAIEMAVGAWVAGDERLLKTINAYHNKTGPDPYIVEFARLSGAPIHTVDKELRKPGKIYSLACQYQSGEIGISGFVNGYGTKTAKEMYKTAIGFASDQELAQAEREFKRDSKNLPKNVFVATSIIKNRWREAHPQYVKAWQVAQTSFMRAVRGSTIQALKCEFGKEGQHIYIQLPSGRRLYFYFARVNNGKLEHFSAHNTNAMYQGLYGGMLFENIVQAIAADLLQIGLERISIYQNALIVMHVHDEIVVLSRTPDVEKLCELFCTKEEWNRDIPLQASGWVGDRYKKD